MTFRTVLPADWNDWDAAAWGRALLIHYFAGHDARPVSRLAISPEELAKAAHAPDSDAGAVRDAFVRVIRTSPSAFRHHLSSASLESLRWNRKDPPPFLAYLLFTCFAAASLDADSAEEGVFRERLRQLLGHDEGTTYALGDLSRLWEAFAGWLQQRHDAGEAYRTLALPHRGRMTLIGYSVRLAFPRREDRLRLRDLLAALGTGANPTVPEAFQSIARSRERFSSDFRQVFDQARSALASGRDVPELQALWSAILEAASLPPRPRDPVASIRYQLLAQEDELGRIDPFVVSTGVHTSRRSGAQFTALEVPFGDYDHFLCAANGSTGLITKLLLMQALEDKVPGLRTSPIARAVRAGVLLFRQVDSAIWELVATRPNEGRVRVLVRASLAEPFLRLVVGGQREARRTIFDGWLEISSFDITELTEPRRADAPELVSVRCLQRVEIGPHLHLVDGIRIDGGYLGLGGLLPEIHCATATGAALLHLSDEAGETRPVHVASLQPVAERQGVFGWPSGQADLEGDYVLAGTRDGRVVAPRRVLFHSRGLRHDYQSPTHPTRWIVETCSPDVAPAGEVLDLFLTPEIGRATPPATAQFSTRGVRLLTNNSIDDDAEHDRLVETLAAISVARKGIAEAELIEILRKVVRHSPGHRTWGIIRGWLEAGYLDSLTRRQWRGRVYFARRPRIVLMADANTQSVRGVLHGLAPYRLRSAIQQAFASNGAAPGSTASLSAAVPTPQSWQFESLEHATATVAAFGEVEMTGVRDPREFAGDFEGAVSDNGPLPPGYERQLVWNWEEGGFRRSNAVTTRDEVRIEYFTRTDGPDRYVITSGGHRRTSISRSWALLYGFRLAERAVFNSAGPLAFARAGDDGPNVPLPIARAIGLRAGVLSGPSNSDALGEHYAYATESRATQRWLMGWLHGNHVDEIVARRFAWLCAATSTTNADGVPLPADLRQRLRSLHSLPDAQSMAGRHIPRHLVAHVRRTIELAEA